VKRRCDQVGELALSTLPVSWPATWIVESTVVSSYPPISLPVGFQGRRAREGPFPRYFRKSGHINRDDIESISPPLLTTSPKLDPRFLSGKTEKRPPGQQGGQRLNQPILLVPSALPRLGIQRP
jgi:hypothetical protein